MGDLGRCLFLIASSRALRTISIQYPADPHAYSSLLNHNNVLHAPISHTSPHDIADSIVLASPPFRTRRLGRVIAPCGPERRTRPALSRRTSTVWSGESIRPSEPRIPTMVGLRLNDARTRVIPMPHGEPPGHAAITLSASPFLDRRSPDLYVLSSVIHLYSLNSLPPATNLLFNFSVRWWLSWTN